MKLLKPMKNLQTTDSESTGPVMVRFMSGLDRMQGLLGRLGVDYPQYRLIVQTKLKLAVRDHVGLGLATNPNRKPSSHPLRNSFLIYLLVGVLMAVFLAIPYPAFYIFSAYFGMIFLMSFLNMLTSYSGMMLDPRDRTLYVTRGVSELTLSLARLTVVGMYMFLNVFALGLPGVVPVFTRFGLPAAIGLIASIIVLAAFAFLLALFIYLLVLHFFDGERLKNILNLVQIVMVIGLYLAGQILPRLHVAAGAFVQGPQHFVWYYILAVPMWFAGIPLLAMGQLSVLNVLLTLLALGITILLAFVYIHHASNFENALAKLEQSDGKRHRDSRYFKLTQHLLTHSAIERTYFAFGWQILREEREYKLRVYPQIAYGLIIPIVFVLAFSLDGTLNQIMAIIGQFGPYMILSLFFGLPLAVFSLRFSTQAHAMRLFQRVPFNQHGLLLRGIVKAMFARLVLIPSMLLTVSFSVLGGVSGLVASLATVGLLYALTLALGRMLGSSTLPFSTEFTVGKQAAMMGVVWLQLGSMVLIAVLILIGGFTDSIAVPIVIGAGAVALGMLTESSYRNGVRYDMRRL